MKGEQKTFWDGDEEKKKQYSSANEHPSIKFILHHLIKKELELLDFMEKNFYMMRTPPYTIKMEDELKNLCKKIRKISGEIRYFAQAIIDAKEKTGERFKEYEGGDVVEDSEARECTKTKIESKEKDQDEIEYHEEEPEPEENFKTLEEFEAFLERKKNNGR
ncbi:MAG: hypothetical protein Nk1A_7180 [Endomicrobiia bacterium]|nr:MAG: hypothetical protein Nk1A_7180 [Endomicrobiia bacterium]